jgi:capsular exopolysaccharide synthesis family protein
MSRIFEALQRSESERLEFAFPEPASVAMLQEAEKEVAPLEPAKVAEPVKAADSARAAEGAKPASAAEEFPSVQVAPTAMSRLVSLTSKESLGAEKFRFLGVRLRQMQQARGLKKLLITSTLSEEGKSLVTANLAATLARRKQQKVLLLEGDLRRPTQAQLFGGTRPAGLSEWLQSGSRTVSNIYHLEGPGFWLMPAGEPPENPLELMQSGKLAELIDHLVKIFDWVVIDSPPVLPLADTSVWSRFADAILLVVRAGRTEKPALQRGLGAIDQSRLIGVVVNNSTGQDEKDYYSRYSPGAVE